MASSLQAQSQILQRHRPCASSSVSAHLKTQSIVCLLSQIINLICQYCCRVSWRCFARSSVILYCCQNPPFMGLWLSFAWENAVKCKSMGSLFFTNFHVIKFTGKIEKQRKRNRHFTCALALRVKFASVFSSKLSFLSCKRQKHECGSWRNKPIPSRNKLGRSPRESWWPKLLDASSYFFTTLKPHDLVPFDLFF